MTLRRVQLPPEVPAVLWLSAMPGRLEPWPQFVDALRRDGVHLVVCLTTLDEMTRLSPAYARVAQRGELPFEWLHLPVPNHGVPEDPDAFRAGVVQVAQALGQGRSVLLHCAAGIGRTGSTAACVLKQLGLSTDRALQRVRDAGSNPDNAQQAGWVRWF